MVVRFCIPYILTYHLDFKVKSYFLLSSCKEIYIIHIKAAIMNCFSIQRITVHNTTKIKIGIENFLISNTSIFFVILLHFILNNTKLF